MDTTTDATYKALAAEAGRYYQSLRRRYPHVCRQCGAAFSGLERAVYCSKPCKFRGIRAAHRADRAVNA